MSLFKRVRLWLVVSCMLLVFLATGAIAWPRAVSTRATAPAATSLALSFTCAQAVDNQYGKVCVHTQPHAALTIKVKYCSGYYATSSSLQGTRYADSIGNYTWYWIPQTSCHGSATAYVTAKWNGQTISKTDTFTVK